MVLEDEIGINDFGWEPLLLMIVADECRPILHISSHADRATRQVGNLAAVLSLKAISSSFNGLLLCSC